MTILKTSSLLWTVAAALALTVSCAKESSIYEQVCDGLRRLIVSGAIADGDKLPSVRALATQLAINPNTIQRAYYNPHRPLHHRL